MRPQQPCPQADGDRHGRRGAADDAPPVLQEPAEQPVAPLTVVGTDETDGNVVELELPDQHGNVDPRQQVAVHTVTRRLERPREDHLRNERRGKPARVAADRPRGALEHGRANAGAGHELGRARERSRGGRRGDAGLCTFLADDLSHAALSRHCDRASVMGFGCASGSASRVPTLAPTCSAAPRLTQFPPWPIECRPLFSHLLWRGRYSTPQSELPAPQSRAGTTRSGLTLALAEPCTCRTAVLSGGAS